MSSEVKRWNVTNENALWASDDGRFVKASDYDALATVCRELIAFGPKHMFDLEDDMMFQKAKSKAIALLGGEKGVGT